MSARLPLNKWSSGQLKLEIASLLDTPGYILMRDQEKTDAGFPVTIDEMREFIQARREADAFLANPTEET
jgi:hypothetical protein